MMTQNTLIGVRDPYGIRPLVIGKLKNSYVLNFGVRGELKSINKLPTKIKTNPIFIDGSVLYLDQKNRVSIVN